MVRKLFFQTKLSKALLALCILGFLAWWNPSFVMKPIAAVTQVLFFPFERLFSYVAFESRETVQFLSSIGELKTRNEELLRENLDLRAEEALLKEVRQENETLRRDFDLNLRKQYQLVAAEVVGLGGLAQGQSLIVNQGSGAHVETGMPVVIGKGILVGKIAEVFIGSARVDLLSSPESMVAVTTPDGLAKGIVRGEHGLGLLFDMVPRTDVFKRGDTIVTSGLGGEFPRGLLVGTLQDPEYTPDKLFQRAPVISPVKYADIRFVSIILRSNP
jgi:rod shape-determining protein MreC